MKPHALAVSAEQVRRLTGLSISQLRYWDKTGFFSPEYATEDRYGAFTRIYSFRDIVGLYAVSLLRKRYQFSLQELRPVGEYLHQYHDTPWASLALYVSGREIVFRDPYRPDHFIGASPDSGQHVIPLEMERVARDLQDKIDQLQGRTPKQIGRIERNRYVVRNAPVLAGTRIPTSAVWNLHKSGYSTEVIRKEYPRLRPKDVAAAIAYETRRKKRSA